METIIKYKTKEPLDENLKNKMIETLTQLDNAPQYKDNCNYIVSSLYGDIGAKNMGKVIKFLYQYCNVDVINECKAIFRRAFATTDLVSIVVPSGVEDIVDEAFYDCLSLESIVLPDTVKYMGDKVFENCINLLSLEINSADPNIYGDNIFKNSPNVVVTCLKGSQMEEYCKELGIKTKLI